MIKIMGAKWINLIPEAHFEASLLMQEELRKHGLILSVRERERIAGAVLRRYLAVIKGKGLKSNNEKRIHPVTEQLIKMRIGHKLEFEPTSHVTMQGRMRTARIRLNNPDARWTCREVDGKTIVTRMDDSNLPTAPRYDPLDNPKAAFLASINVGHSKLAPTDLFPVHAGSIDGNVKVQAKKIVDNANAKWHQVRTNKGVRIWRDK